jgi:hypothetical protein
MDQEVWYEIEVSHRDDLSDWNRYGNGTYDSVATASRVLDGLIATFWKYRIVKVTATREVVS